MEDGYAKAFGCALRELREERGRTQQDVWLNAGIHKTTISLWERGEQLPRLERLLALCDELGIQASTVFQRTEQLLAQRRRSRKKAPERRGRGRPRKKR